MTNKLYKLMNWPLIEEIIYSESCHPGEVLGAHQAGTQTLIQAFFPKAKKVTLCVPSLDYEKNMELADEDGFYAALVPSYGKLDYYYIVKDVDGESKKVLDPYSFGTVFEDKDYERFAKGIHYSVYRLLGAHPVKMGKTEGTFFALWAPNAIRVSVVGDFNDWDGRIHQMNLAGASGIYELFIPGVKIGDKYKFEIKLRDGLTYLKADPYCFEYEDGEGSACVVSDTDFLWTDKSYLEKRSEFKADSSVISIYETSLTGYGDNYESIAENLINHVKETGYTHVELMPVMEYTSDDSLGYETTGYYAPTKRFGTPKEFAGLINRLHEEGIGVILDWNPAHFPDGLEGLSDFDGTKLYENPDERRRYSFGGGLLNYNFSRFEVSNFLIANALFWVERYHADALRLPFVSSMLYLDYNKCDGEWTPNMYGGNEDLDAIEFIKHLNSILHKRNPGVFTVAKEESSFAGLTGDLNDGGLGFDFKWNNGWSSDFINYIKFDPYFRAHHHNDLTFSMIYAYSERFILPFSHEDVSRGLKSMLSKMPGDEADRFANLRLAYSFMFMHPGRKLLFMGQDVGDDEEWRFDKKARNELNLSPLNSGLHDLVKALNELYKAEPALHVFDDYSEGFEWINCISSNACYVSFLRKAESDKDLLLVIANFAGIDQKLRVGVPLEGTYKEIFNSDDVKFGGNKPSSNKRARKSIKGEFDGRLNSIKTDINRLSLVVYKYSGE